MKEHKFTDEEIIRALELCFAQKGTTETCAKCSYHKFGKLCKVKRDKDALDLINRQRAEVEKWYHEYHCIKFSLEQEKQYSRETHKLADFYFIQLQKARANIIGAIEARVKEYLKGLIDRGVDAVEVTEFNAELHKIINGGRECPQCGYFVGCEGAVGGVVCGDFKEKEAEKDCGKG